MKKVLIAAAVVGAALAAITVAANVLDYEKRMRRVRL